MLITNKNIDKNAVFLNSSFLYHPASLAGRPIYMGWPYFIWGAGYNTAPRGNFMEMIYKSNNKEFICTKLVEEKIDYFTTQDTSGDPSYPPINLVFFDSNFIKSYFDQTTVFSVFSTQENCKINVN